MFLYIFVGFILAGGLLIWAINARSSDSKTHRERLKPDDEVIQESPSEEEPPTEVQSLDLNGRILNALANAGIETVEELEKYSDDFSKIDGIGPKRSEKIESALE